MGCETNTRRGVVPMIQVGDLVRYSNKWLRQSHLSKRFRNSPRMRNRIMRVLGVVRKDRAEWFLGKMVKKPGRLLEVDVLAESPYFSEKYACYHDSLLRFVARPGVTRSPRPGRRRKAAAHGRASRPKVVATADSSPDDVRHANRLHRLCRPGHS